MITRKLQNMSIRHKLTAVIMLTSTVIMLVGIVIFVGWEQIDRRREVAWALEGNAGIIAYNCRASLAFSDRDDAAQVLSGLEAKTSIVFGCIYDKQGQVFATYNRADIGTGIETPVPEQDGHCFENGYLSVFRQIQLDGERIGTVYLRDDMSELQGMFGRAVAVSAPIVLLALAIGFLLCVRFQTFVSGPIVSLAAVAKRFSQQKDYNLRAIKKSNDEVGALIDAFNEMLEQIQKEINERTEAEACLKRLTKVLECTPDFVGTARPDGRVTYINAAGNKMIDWAGDDDLCDKKIADIHPDWALKIIEEQGLPGAAKDGVWAGETALLHRNGSELPVSQVIMSHKSADGNIEYFSTVMRDISERKKAELIIHEHNEMLEKTVQERTAELEKSIAEIERFNRLMIGREQRVIEMKKEVNALLAELGREPQYQSVFKDQDNEIISPGNSL